MENITLPKIVGLGVYDANAVRRYRGASVTVPRVTEEYEIELPAEDGGVSVIDGKEYPIRHDQLIFVRPGQERYTRLPFRCWYVHLDPASSVRSEPETPSEDALRPSYRCRSGQYRSPVHTPVEAEPDDAFCRLFDGIGSIVRLSDVPRTEQLFRDIIGAAATEQKDGELFMQSRLLELVWYMRHDARLFAADAAAVRHSSIAGAMAYIESNIDRSLTLEELAQSQHLSPVYFHRLFTKTFGVTPYRYILERKLAIAKNQLLMTNRSCLDIALGLGFSSQSYFNYAFRKEVGVSPLQYRRQWYSRYPK